MVSSVLVRRRQPLQSLLVPRHQPQQRAAQQVPVAEKNDANTIGKYSKGMAVFTIANGGLMYEASVGRQKFSYKPK
ncbi:hypothetical protein MNBD_GAMMA09-1302 [hydrothermal vent metagenome]|uniref:Uncharacterized protein n=1 Tax=hydrothermal vent metagenome TaxID=652676 RepID=A0A3B0X781_9ZZZZ